MRFGVAAGADQIETAARAGYDYLELPLNKLDQSPDGLKALRGMLAEAGIAAERMNCFFPGQISLYGALDPVLFIAEKQLDTAKALGTSLVVIGSGAARKVPEGMEMAAAEEWFLSLLERVGKLAGDRGIRIALEPLNRAETNFVNTVPEGLAFCRKLSDPNVGCLIDFYHFWKNGESLQELEDVRPEELFHVHLARPNDDRSYPRPEDRAVLERWAKSLKALGYDESISLECSWRGEFDPHAREALEELRVFGRRTHV